MLGHSLAQLICWMGNAPARDRAVILGAFALPSALLSTYVADVPHAVLWHTPLTPALWFGMVLIAACALWTSRNAFDLVVVFLTSFCAWIAAYEATAHFNDMMLSQIHAAAPRSDGNFDSRQINYLTGICGAFGGFVGSTIVIFGMSLVVVNLRSFAAWAQTLLLGTMTGSFAELVVEPSADGLPIHIGTLLPMFLFWQVSVAASMAYNVKPQLTYSAPPKRPLRV